MPMEIESKEKLKIWVEYHPHYKGLCEKIIKDSVNVRYVAAEEMGNVNGGPTNVRALQTLPLNFENNSSIFLICDWILTLLKQRFPYDFFIEGVWLNKYKKGDFTYPHCHMPCAFSFVYFVKCPKGSSPLVFTTSGKRIKAEEGKLLLFPGFMKHHVPKNRCDDRIVLAGNIRAVLE